MTDVTQFLTFAIEITHLPRAHTGHLPRTVPPCGVRVRCQGVPWEKCRHGDAGEITQRTRCALWLSA
jgi:hypothetical protein